MGTARRVPWVAYEELLQNWQGEFGGTDVVAAYRQFVEFELEGRVPSPFAHAIDGWILGSAEFAQKIRALISPASHEPALLRQRRVAPCTFAEILSAVCEYYGVLATDLARRGSRHPARTALATLARAHSSCTFAELAQRLGLARRDCVPNLFRRAKRDLAIAHDIKVLEEHLQLTTNND